MSLSVASARHVQALLGSIGRLSRNMFATTLTLLVIGLALALPMALRLFVANAQAATGDFANAVDMSVYFKPDVPLTKAQQLAADARQRSEVGEVTVIPADKALEEFIHLLATEGYLGSNRLILAQFEIRDAFLGPRFRCALAGNQRELGLGFFQRLLHVSLGTHRSVNHYLFHFRNLVHVFVAVLLLQRRHDVIFVVPVKLVFHS